MVLDRIGDKWSVLVVLSLIGGPMRFTQLRAQIGGVTPKVLTQTLRAMEQDGLVTREVFAEVPPRVEYTLTDLGRSLHEPISAVAEWAEQNIVEIIRCREKSA
ncbi:helix-turn-helix transcriptional regulator [Nonomuraea sp. NBC_00507]|uniref:winged helix-turn-helix transcriptional regulator n=1 Tax=Nonomuraea sp. NBC_00507 TaxID=2976002 RepID=UPI002E17FDD1